MTQRRALRAALPLLGLLAAASLVQAQSDPAAPATPDGGAGPTLLPEALNVPEPRVGDAGTYSRSVVKLEGARLVTHEAPAPRESFRWEDAEVRRDSRGIQHAVDTLHVWSHYDGVDAKHHLSSDGGATVAVEYLSAGEEYYTRTYIPGIDSSLVCGTRSTLQGGTTLTVGSHDLFPGFCRRAYYAQEAGTTWTAVRADPWGDSVAVGFQQDDASRAALAWFVDSIPYPVRILEQLDTGQPTYAVLDLTSFSRGTHALGSPPAEPDPLPAIRFASTVDGFPEGGPDDEWPYADALAEAESDSGVQDFLQSHPRAQVQFALRSQSEGTYDDEKGQLVWRELSWHLDFDDGYASHSVMSVWRTETQTVVGIAPLPAQTSTFVRVAKNLGSSGLAPVAGPHRMPDIGSAMAWWEGFRGPEFVDRQPNAPGFSSPCWGCPPGVLATVGGYAHGDVETEGSLLADPAWTARWEASFIFLGTDGQMNYMIENIRDESAGVPSGLAEALGDAIGTPLESIIQDVLEKLPPKRSLPVKTDIEVVPRVRDDAPGSDTLAASAEPTGRSVRNGPDLTVPAVVAGSAVAAVGLGWLFKAAFMALFSRIRGEEALRHPVRAAILEAVRAEPGIHVQEIARRTDQGMGNLRHHLKKLEDGGFLKASRAAGYVCYFPDATGVHAMRAAPVLKSQGARNVLEAVRAGAAKPVEVAARTGLSPTTVDHHLDRLSGAGLVSRAPGGLMATAQGRDAVPT